MIEDWRSKNALAAAISICFDVGCRGNCWSCWWGLTSFHQFLWIEHNFTVPCVTISTVRYHAHGWAFLNLNCFVFYINNRVFNLFDGFVNFDRITNPNISPIFSLEKKSFYRVSFVMKKSKRLSFIFMSR